MPKKPSSGGKTPSGGGEVEQITTTDICRAIRPGDRVTILNRYDQRRTGRAVMRSATGGWVLNMGGPHGTPGLADNSNIVGVKPCRHG